MHNRSRRRWAVVIGLLVGAAFLISLAAILKIVWGLGDNDLAGEQTVSTELTEKELTEKDLTSASENRAEEPEGDPGESGGSEPQSGGESREPAGPEPDPKGGLQESAEVEPDSEGESQGSSEPAAGSEGETESVAENEGAPETASEPELSKAQSLLNAMTTEEKVYQLFMVFPSQVTGVSPVTAAGETTRKGLAKYPVGGFIYNKSNMVSREQVTKMLTTVQTLSKIPLLLTCDEEGGRVNRLMSTVGTTYIDNMMSYRDQGTEKAAENAGIIAGDMAACGFNMDFAPVADVWSNPQNTVIGDRAYSDDFGQAAELVASAVEGFHGGGIACTLKHFPGHGDTAADSHTGAAYVTKTLDELRGEELLPFQSGIDAGADAVMIGHLTVTDIEDIPALFSYRIVTRLLREEMGFEGVIITDSLQMKAVTDYYDSGQAAVLAVKAGVDMLLCPADLEEAAKALLDAVEAGEISEERLDESVLRILKLKEKYGILE